MVTVSPAPVGRNSDADRRTSLRSGRFAHEERIKSAVSVRRRVIIRCIWRTENQEPRTENREPGTENEELRTKN
jgi:hypothetical protein